MNLKDTQVIITRKLPDLIEKRMLELFNVQLCQSRMPLNKNELIKLCKNATILVPTLGDELDEVFFQKINSKIKLIANYGAGYDHIDINKAHKKKIVVTNTPDVLTNDTADVTMALILFITRNLPKGIRIIKENKWEGWSPTEIIGNRLSGKKLGILGMGRIGQAVAKKALSFGLKINYHNRNRLHEIKEKELQATFWSNLNHMLREIDILSIHVPHTPSTFHLLNNTRLKLLKRNSFIINTARGEIIDERSLTRMLRLKEIAGAGLDVHENGNNVNVRLKELENVILLPHMSSSTEEGRIEMGEKVIMNIKAFIDGHTPPDKIIPDF